MRHFTQVDVLISDQYQHCCLAQHVGRCTSSNDGFSTCEALLAKPVMKAIVYIVGVIGIIANICVIIERMKDRENERNPHFILISNLALSDAGYSLYLLIIGVADTYYAGAYILYDEWWRSSFLCQSLSILSILSSELSIAILVCITIDRYMTISNVSRLRLRHLSKKLPTIMLSLAWSITLCISLLPLLLSWLFGERYSISNSICIFLEMSAHSVYRPVYLLCVHVIMNGLCFLVILILYAQIIHISIQSSRKVGRGTNIKLFKRTLLIVFTNFLCWAPIAGYILFSYSGMSPSSDVTVWMAVFVLPISSAANPVIYTLLSVCKVVLSRVSEYSYASLLHCQNEYTLLDSINRKH